MGKPLRVLIVEDSETDARLVLHQLKHGGYEPEYERVETAEAMKSALGKKDWDVILCDYTMPRFDGPAAIALLRETGLDIPIIIVSGAIGEETAVAAMKTGAHDYIMKDKLARLVPAIEREIEDAKTRSLRREIAEQLRESEKRFCLVFQHAPVSMAIGTLEEGRFLDVNEQYLRFTEFSREELIGHTAMELNLWVDPEERKKVFDAISRHQGGVSSHSVSVRTKSGTIKDVLFSADIININNVPHLLSSALDITERKGMEAELREAEEKYRSIFEGAKEGIYRTTPEGRIVMANPAMARILGYESPHEMMTVINDLASQLYVNHEQRAETIKSVEENDYVTGWEVQFYRKDGTVVWCSRSMRAIRDDKGKTLYYEGIIEDITERRQSTERLRKALRGSVHAIVVMVETKDPYTAGHQRRVSDLARAIATQMNLPHDQIDGLRTAATIHDIGKISVPTEILSMPRKLNRLEFSLIKTHPQSGYDILKDIEFPWPIARMILEHHELMDGSGYPHGLTGDKLLMESRILTVADVVEAIASHRPYRPGLGIGAALEEITSNRGIRYDPEAVDACLRLFNEKGYKIVD